MKAIILTDYLDFYGGVKALNDTGKGAVPVIYENGTLAGIITDGDVRRAILQNDLSIDAIINKDPIRREEGLAFEDAIVMLKRIKRRHLPIVDKNNKYIKMISLDDYDFYQTAHPVVIMAGGLGSRLGALTKDTPKPMLKVGEKPIIQNIMDSFIEAGFKKFYFCVNYKADVVKSYFKDGSEFGVEVSYIEEEKKLGTAGALYYLKDKVKESFFVINGDVLSTTNFNALLDFHKEKKSEATMCVRKIEVGIPFGVVDVEGSKVISLREKPINNYNINTGIYHLEPSVLTKIEREEYLDMPCLLSRLIQDDMRVSAFEIEDACWIDVGHVEDYTRVNKAFSMRGSKN